ncbi:MAG TPA: sn-glycerol-3-phosphate ABC transporter substrate-binding protein UgpB [Stellaceae bacterium]
MSALRSWLLALALIVSAAPMAVAETAPIEIQWWHAMTAVNGERVNKIAEDFNKSQSAYKVVPVYKGNYPETMSAGIAAFRAGNAPHIIQIFEVGTATMMAAKGAIKPVYQLMAEAGEKFDPAAYLPTVTGYYSTSDGKMLSLPFNSSSAIGYYNKDAFEKAGLDPAKPPKTWPEWFADAKKIRAAGYPCGFTAGWITWTQIEQLNAWHNLPIGTKANGMDGLDTQFVFNTPFEVKHIGALVEAQKDKSFDYGGRYADAESKFLSGECGMLQSSSSFYGNVAKNAKFKFATVALPYYPEVQGAPQNTIIGGASLWVMGGKKPEEYKGVAKFFAFLSQTPLQVEFHKATGYLPITKAAYDALKEEGYYQKNPDIEVTLKELTNKPPTENSRGLRFGNLVQIRDAWAEDLEAAFAGKETAQEAVDNAVKRGNAILRQFEAAAK